MEVKPLDDTNIELIHDFIERATPGSTCLFCTGGYNCRCGSCPQEEYHADGCLVKELMWLRWAWRCNKPVPQLVADDDAAWLRKRVKELEEEIEGYSGDIYIPSKPISKLLEYVNEKLDQLIAGQKEGAE